MRSCISYPNENGLGVTILGVTILCIVPLHPRRVGTLRDAVHLLPRAFPPLSTFGRRRTRRTFIGRTDERPFRGAMIERSHFRREVWTFQDACVRVPLQTHATSRTATLQFGSGSACSQPISINSAGRVDSVTPTLGRSMMVTPCVNWGSES